MDGIHQITYKIITIVPCALLSHLLSLGFFLLREIRDYKSIVRSFGNIHLWMEFGQTTYKVLTIVPCAGVYNLRRSLGVKTLTCN